MKGAMLERTAASAKKDKRKQSSGSESEQCDDVAAALEKRKRQKQLDRALIRRAIEKQTERMPELWNIWLKHKPIILYFAFQLCNGLRRLDLSLRILYLHRSCPFLPSPTPSSG
jgi:hypothetical protein